MSSGQMARTPANFPRMKYRAAKRHARNSQYARLSRTVSVIGEAFVRFVASVDWDGLRRQMEALRRLAAAIHEHPPGPIRRPWFLALDEAQALGARGRAGI